MSDSMNVNINFKKYPELFKALEIMVAAKDSDNNKFIRSLVRQAWEKHASQEYDRTTDGLKLVNRKARNGKKSIQTLKAEQA